MRFRHLIPTAVIAVGCILGARAISAQDKPSTSDSTTESDRSVLPPYVLDGIMTPS